MGHMSNKRCRQHSTTHNGMGAHTYGQNQHHTLLFSHLRINGNMSSSGRDPTKPNLFHKMGPSDAAPRLGWPGQATQPKQDGVVCASPRPNLSLDFIYSSYAPPAGRALPLPLGWNPTTDATQESHGTYKKTTSHGTNLENRNKRYTII
jgi:hypothetical protein